MANGYTPAQNFATRRDGRQLVLSIGLSLDYLDLESKLMNGPMVYMGCGTDAILGPVQEAYPKAQTIGIDKKIWVLQQAKLNSPLTQFVLADLRKALPFDDNTIPILYSRRLYQLCNEKPEDFVPILKESFRVLKPGDEGVYLLFAEGSFDGDELFYQAIKDVGFETIRGEKGYYLALRKPLAE